MSIDLNETALGVLLHNEFMGRGKKAMVILMSVKDGAVTVYQENGEEAVECQVNDPKANGQLPDYAKQVKPFSIHSGPGGSNCIYICGLFGCRQVCG